jgi:hypothetical protein
MSAQNKLYKPRVCVLSFPLFRLFKA